MQFNFNPTEAEVYCLKISGRAKAAARDVDALKSLKVILRMDFSCGAYRFSILRRNIFFGNKLKINLKKKNLNKDVELQVQEVQEHNMLRAENQVGGTVEPWLMYVL